MEKVLYLYDKIFLEHETGSHPENKMRLISINEKIANTELSEITELTEPRKANDEDILRIHTKEYIDFVRREILNGNRYLDLDTVVSHSSLEAAYFAAGAGLTAADKIIAGEFRRAFCAVRPPGHHAEKDKAMGFCIFNNIAITARYLQQVHNLEKILILDWDVHHGNSTQHSFYDDDTVYYISLHQYPFYPGTGGKNETGTGAGEKYTLNFPMPAGTGDSEWLAAFDEKIINEIKNYKPDFILISAGFDAHIDDPLASISIHSETFGKFTDLIKSAADSADGRIIAFLEGGYNLEALAESVFHHIKSLARD